MAGNKKTKKKSFWRVLLVILAVIAAILLVLAVFFTIKRSKVHDFGDRLEKIEGVSSVERIWQLMPAFEEKYLVTFTQPLDWDDPDKGTFEQRVEIGYKGDDNVNVYSTSGYCLNDAVTGNKLIMRIDDREELSRKYKGNYIAIEYRFFGESTPEGFSVDSADMWEYLTVENAAKDFHNIMEQLSPILGGKKIFTGGSKGGYTTNTMAYFYPDYCDAYVAYVAPFCDGTEDVRFVQNIYETIGDVGYSKEEAAYMRRSMLDFEVCCIENRDELEGLYYDKAIKAGNEYRDAMTKDILWDMAVMEFGVSYWQYGKDFDAIRDILDMPDTTEKEHEKKIKKMCKIVAENATPDNWSIKYFAVPYYWQALNEMGSYKYDYSYLREAVIEKTGEDMLAITEDMEEGILARLMFTDEQQAKMHYDGSTREKMLEWSKTTDAHVIMVYGGCDVWYAVRIPETDNDNIHDYVVDKGSHMSLIFMLDEEERNECWEILDGWLGKLLSAFQGDGSPGKRLPVLSRGTVLLESAFTIHNIENSA